MITGKTYDSLKFLALIAFPALGSAYFALAGIWGLPAAEQVVGTIVVVDTFLGTILQISSSKFTAKTGQGVITVAETDKGKTYSLVFDGDPEEELTDNERFVFDVKTTKK
jgi:hypothetical protein